MSRYPTGSIIVTPAPSSPNAAIFPRVRPRPDIQRPVRRGDSPVVEKHIRHVRIVVLASRCSAFLVGSDPEVVLDVLRLPPQTGVLADRGLHNLVAGEQLGDDIALLVETLDELPLLRGKW